MNMSQSDFERNICLASIFAFFSIAMYVAFHEREHKFHLNQKVKWADSFYGECKGTVIGEWNNRSLSLISGITCSYGAYVTPAGYIDDSILSLAE